MPFSSKHRELHSTFLFILGCSKDDLPHHTKTLLGCGDPELVVGEKLRGVYAQGVVGGDILHQKDRVLGLVGESESPC